MVVGFNVGGVVGVGDSGAQAGGLLMDALGGAGADKPVAQVDSRDTVAAEAATAINRPFLMPPLPRCSSPWARLWYMSCSFLDRRIVARRDRMKSAGALAWRCNRNATAEVGSLGWPG